MKAKASAILVLGVLGLIFAFQNCAETVGVEPYQGASTAAVDTTPDITPDPDPVDPVTDPVTPVGPDPNDPRPDISERPFGISDTSNGSATPSINTASGWALDYDSPSQSITVRIYVGGPHYASNVYFDVPTNIPRPDVNAIMSQELSQVAGRAIQITGNHGYSFTAPAQYQGQGLYAYGIDPQTQQLSYLNNQPGLAQYP